MWCRATYILFVDKCTKRKKLVWVNSPGKYPPHVSVEFQVVACLTYVFAFPTQDHNTLIFHLQKYTLQMTTKLNKGEFC